jgi:hypothetical protein
MRDYIVTHPDGHEEMIRGLREFCLRWRLSQFSLNHVARGRVHQHNGFKIRYAVDPFPAKPKTAPRTYVITHPGGREEVVTGLTAFCKEHGLAAGHMTFVAQGKNSHHKGYGCKCADPDIASRYLVLSRRVRKVAVGCTKRMVPCEVCRNNFEAKFKHAKYCPTCREGATHARHKKYYAKNKDRMDANHKAYVEANRASFRAGRRKYYLANKEKPAASDKKN